MTTDRHYRRVHLAKVSARTAPAAVWVYQGLVPKLLSDWSV